MLKGVKIIHNLTTITAKRICSSKPQFAILERHTDVINQRDEVVLSYDSVVMRDHPKLCVNLRCGVE